MKFTLSWLKDHLETEASVEEIVETLTDLGLEVEEVEDRGARLADFTIGKVLSAEKHASVLRTVSAAIALARSSEPSLTGPEHDH
jgi:phenylalanyl-tRNA synthetase beta chain